MATITPVSASAAGNAVTFAAASVGGDSLVVNSNRVTLVVRNAGSSITVTLAGSIPCSQGFTHNVAVTCPVGDTDILIPPQVISASTGNVGITYSSVTSVTVAAVI